MRAIARLARLTLALDVPFAAYSQQCSSCLDQSAACTALPCESGVSASDDKLYIGGLFATTPGDLDGGLENADHFLLAAALINDKTDGSVHSLSHTHTHTVHGPGGRQASRGGCPSRDSSPAGTLPGGD